VKPDATWPERLNVVIGKRLSEFRRVRGLTAAQLAERCAALGLPISRSKIANMENGRARQEGISVAEVHVLAAALNVPPALMQYPIWHAEPVEVLPRRETSSWTAYRWFCGDVTTAYDDLADPHERDPFWRDADDLISTYRRHDSALSKYLELRGSADSESDATQVHLALLAATRREMERARWWLPPMPSGAAQAVDEQLRAWGFHTTQPDSQGARP